MRPDLGDLVSALTLAAIAVLLLPKRDWKSIPARLVATARGERRHIFRAPTGRGAFSQDYIERWFQLIRRELGRVIELGIPLHAIAVEVEARGATQRQVLADQWAATRAGLLFEHLAGRATEADLHDQLRVRGHPPLAAKLRWTPAPKLTMPPMEWRLEWESHLEALRRQVHPAPGNDRAPLARHHDATASHVLQIRTLGEIHISAGGDDFAPTLLHRPSLALPWFYLLARETLKAGDRTARAVLGDEWFPALSADQQRTKVRRRLNDMCGDMSGPLAGMVKTEGEYVSLDLSSCDYDVCRLFELAEKVQASDDLLAAPFLGEVEEVVGELGKEWLPGWEEVERRATEGRSGAGKLITDVRNRIDGVRITLLEAYADRCLAGGRQERVIGYLEEALRRRPDRSGLARRLADAYEQIGQARRAVELRNEHGLDAAS